MRAIISMALSMFTRGVNNSANRAQQNGKISQGQRNAARNANTIVRLLRRFGRF